MSKVLVAYFSSSGVTARLAETLAKAVGGDLFEIKPAVPYTDADLNWMDKTSRSTLEMKDRSCRPEIGEKLSNMADYDVVFVGFPVWWYREPSIIDTFVEEYDFGGKTLVPFATSGGSGIGDSGENMAKLAPGAKVDAGKKFSASASESELRDWASKWI